MAAVSVEDLSRVLVDVYGAAERELQRILASADSTDFQRWRAGNLRPQVDAVLRRLRQANGELSKRVVLQSYQEAAEAITREGFAFDVVDARAVEALAARMAGDLN